MHHHTRFIHLPNHSVKVSSIHGHLGGRGYGTVLLDNGMGGQSSYTSIDDYIEKTGRNPLSRNATRTGQGLADKISSKLSKLNVGSKPKRKNIVMSF